MTLVLSGLAALWWINLTMKLYISFRDYDPGHINRATVSPCGDYHAQKEYILSHPLYFPKVIFHSLFDHPFNYLSGYTGLFGNLDIPLPGVVHIVSYVILFIIAVTEKNKFGLGLRIKLCMNRVKLILSFRPCTITQLLFIQHMRS